MNIESLSIEYEGEIKQFEFKSNNLIYSEKNSVGKSTLLRLIFFSLGYAVPGTKKLKFKKCITRLKFQRDNYKIVIHRSNDIVKVIINDGVSEIFSIPSQEYQLLSLIWGTENICILKNILGAIYFDQEKGWTLLNRGKVIGNIPFNVEELVRGLAEKDVSSLIAEKKVTQIELNKYLHLERTLEYKNQLTSGKNILLYPDHHSELQARLDELKLEESDIQKEIKSMNDAKKDNYNFLKYIENMKITIRDPDTSKRIPVSKETIEYFDENQEYLKTRLKIEKIKLAQLKEKIDILEQQIAEGHSLFNLKTEIERFDAQVAKFSFDYKGIQNIIVELKNRVKEIDEKIKVATYSNNEIIVNMESNIKRYLKRLGAEEFLEENGKDLFTTDLKSLSGAVLHKMVFAYKMSYIKELEKILNYKLPIVLDSPSGRELDPINIEETFKILSEDFNSNQLIIASIFEYRNNSENLNVIKIKKRLLEDSKLTIETVNENDSI